MESSKPYFYLKNDTDKVYWVDWGPEEVGAMAVSFDREKILYLFQDYPHKFTAEQKALFDKENPYWARFFAGRP